MILAALAALGATAVAFVLYPVFARTPADLAPDAEETEDDFADLAEPELSDHAKRELSDLEEKKDRLLESISDLDFEKDAGKVSDADYQEARNDYLAQVAAILTRQDELRSWEIETKNAASPAVKDETRPEMLKCVACGVSSPTEARYCIGCGAAFEARCEGCGQELPGEARFCMACGKPVQGRKAHETA